MQQSITAQGDLGLIINECIARHNARPSKAQLIVGLPLIHLLDRPGLKPNELCIIATAIAVKLRHRIGTSDDQSSQSQADA